MGFCHFLSPFTNRLVRHCFIINLNLTLTKLKHHDVIILHRKKINAKKIIQSIYSLKDDNYAHIY